MNLHILLRLSRLVRRPPNSRTVKVVLFVLGVVAVFWGIEVMFGWPEWLTPRNNFSRRTGI